MTIAVTNPVVLHRWKQRDIHEKREQRRLKINHLRAQINCNQVLLPKITDISSKISDPASSTPPSAFFNSLVEQLQTNPSRDCPPGNDPSKFEQTYDGMIHSLLSQVGQTAKVKVKDAGVADAEKEERLSKALATELAEHVTRLQETIVKDAKELEAEEKEQQKHITSEDLHDGFENKASWASKPTPYASLTAV